MPSRRVGQDRAVAEARGPNPSAPEPADDVAGGDPLGDERKSASSSCSSLVRPVARIAAPHRRRRTGPGVRVPHHEAARTSELQVPDGTVPRRCSSRPPRLDVDPRRRSRRMRPFATVVSATPPARQRLRDWVCFRAGRRVEVGLFQNPAATAMSRGGASVPRRLPAWGRRPLQAGREEPDRRRPPRPRSCRRPARGGRNAETQLKSPSSRTSSCICSR